MRTGERGLTLIEILIALAIFAIIVVGALGAVGATNAGLTDAFPTAFGAGRAAKDYTVASTYLQGFQEYMAGYVDGSTMPDPPSPPSILETGSPHSFDPSDTDVFGYSIPSAQPFQLAWSTLVVDVQRWYWQCTPPEYGATVPPTGPTIDQLILVRATLTWALKGASRSVTVERFVPHRPDIGLTVTPCP